jgi:hypothetical protein
VQWSVFSASMGLIVLLWVDLLASSMAMLVNRMSVHRRAHSAPRMNGLTVTMPGSGHLNLGFNPFRGMVQRYNCICQSIVLSEELDQSCGDIPDPWYGRRNFGPQCKVDILVPGTLHLPPSHITWVGGFPLVPFSVLLLFKLQAWSDHREAVEHFKWQKQYTGQADIEQLMALRAAVGLRLSRPWKDEELFDKEFQQLSKKRVKMYCSLFPDCTEGWRLLGFKTS